jgi:hypothetical protein
VPRSAPKGHSLRGSAMPPERRPHPIGPRPRPRPGKATRAGPTLCLLLSYCLVPCSAHWCSVRPGPLSRHRSPFDRSALLRTNTTGKGSSALRVARPGAHPSAGASFAGDCFAPQPFPEGSLLLSPPKPSLGLTASPLPIAGPRLQLSPTIAG